MSPIQQMLLGVGAVAKKTYVDDIFSTYVYKGNSTDGRAISTGVDMTEGGLVWTKVRDASTYHVLHDTVNTGKFLQSQSTDSLITSTTTVTGFSSTGYTLGTDSAVNHSNNTYASWTFRKSPGFFDCVSYTGDGSSSGRQIAHSLGSVPGCIMVKCTDATNNWAVYHRGTDPSIPENYGLNLNNTNARVDNEYYWHDTKPTSTHFTIRDNANVNDNGKTYIAYIFAGGESTAATATSVEFDGSNDDLTIPSSTDFDFGSGDFTIECWIKPDVVTAQGVINRSVGGASSNSSWIVYIDSGNFDFYWVDSSAPNTWSGPISGTSTLPTNQWSHIAVAREGTKLRLFVNGILDNTNDVSFTIPTSTRDVEIGSQNGNSFYDGHISNVRIVKGTAVYTSSFRPPTEPLSNITNTKLLCCQGSTATSATVIPSGSITNDGATHSSDSPFDDPAAHVFGESGSESVIKCGSYVGTGSVGHKIELGWEPSFIIFKNSTDSGANWEMVDVMRGNPASDGTTSQDANFVRANTSGAEFTNRPFSPYSTGFEIRNSGGGSNGSGSTYIYMAIRRPDGYVGKPAEAGTDVFAMDTGNSSTTIPTFDSGFPLDFALLREPNSSGYFYATARLIEKNYMFTNSSDAESTASTSWTWDSNAGWNKAGYNTDYQSWMFKRHAGFDVVAYTSNNAGVGTGGTQIPHSLGKAPEMIWIKNRDSATPWTVGHTGLNGGTNPWTKYIFLGTGTEATASSIWNDTAPTSTHFTLGNYGGVNDTDYFIAMLFASVDGISKVGYYTGTGSTQTITTGFQPRFVIIKNVDQSGTGWYVIDTTRGWGSGDDKYLFLDADSAQADHNFGAPTSTGFTVDNNFVGYNFNSHNYIYYAHA